MENPTNWNQLTAAVAAVGLDDVSRLLEFLQRFGVASRSLTAGELETIVDKVRVQGEITGPSESARIAGEISHRGFATEAASEPDPGGKRAATAMLGFDSVGVMARLDEREKFFVKNHELNAAFVDTSFDKLSTSKGNMRWMRAYRRAVGELPASDMPTFLSAAERLVDEVVGDHDCNDPDWARNEVRDLLRRARDAHANLAAAP